MGIADGLASALGTRTQDANEAVAARCLAEPALLGELAAVLAGKNARLAGDAAEAMTKVAERRPELAAPHAGEFLAGLEHRNGRVRWESAHALALVAGLAPALVAGALPRLAELVRDDESVIVRDYVLDAVAGYAATGAAAAGCAWPLLREGLVGREGRHAGRVLRALAAVVAVAPALRADVRGLAGGFAEDARPGVRKAARALLEAIDGT
jgi:hypothetical protein